MSDPDHLEKKIAGLKITHASDDLIGRIKSEKKIGPAVPPKPKKPQPQVPQSYTIKAPPIPSYSTLLNNTETNEIPINLYSNLSISDRASKSIKNDCHRFSKPHHDKILSPQDLDENQSRATAQTVVYSNVKRTMPPTLPSTNIPNGNDLLYSNIHWNQKCENVYSNIPVADQNEDLPPPPEPAEYIPCVTENIFPPPPEELPPPPSPVSSSYSELRRATYQTDYPSGNYSNDIYGPESHSSSTYESIYEPINPRPSSELSCNYSMYSGYGSGMSAQPQNKILPIKQVDALTDLLVQGMEDPQEESDIYGVCAQCEEKVEGEGTGCSAMDKVFHIRCFCCYICRVNLQGKPFYSLEAKPYCEEDYLNTLEKCCVCTLPILDRILRATGKPYHPSCFTCVVCGQSLDGIPFTVDATNQIHCIQCFHKKFAPRCCVCKLPIMPEPGQDETVRVVALDRSFHIQCYKCEDCGLVLSSDSEGHGCYPLDDHILCKSCNAVRIQTLTSHMTTEL